MIKEFNNLKEIKKYYDEATNTYVFKNNDEYIDLVVFNFDLDVEANIHARDIIASNIKARDINANNIKARDIIAWDITAGDINAGDINARNINAFDIDTYNIDADDISYYAVCFAYKNIKCKSIKGRRNNSEYFVLDGEIIFIKDEEIENE